MSSITRVAARTVRLNNTTLATAYGSGKNTREHLFLAVYNETGLAGIAEGSPLPHFSGEQASEMKVVVEQVLAPAIIGLDAFNLEAIQQALDRALARNESSKSALINAVHDLQGKLLNAPVTQILGGRLRERVPVAGAVGIEDHATIIARAHTLFERGITTFKFKVGSDVRRDLGAIAAVRAEFGDAVELRADANGGYSLADARRFLRGVERFDPQYVEQPLPAQDLRGLALLRQASLVPIAVDESLFGLRDAIEIIKHDAADVFVIKLIKLGGLFNARKVVALAEAAGITCVCVSPYETDLGGSANVHLAASSSAFRYAAELGTGVSQVALPGAARLGFEAGHVPVPASPGLGIDLPAGFFEEARPA